MKRSIRVFAVLVLLSAGVTVYGWLFTADHGGKAHLAEVTIEGSREAASGLAVGFRADSASDLHWLNSFDFDAGKGTSVLKRGEMAAREETPLYDEIRFVGSSAVPFFTRLTDGRLNGLQDKEIQRFYDGLQQKALESGSEEKGQIRLGDYLDFYPVSFDFQFGTKRYDSDGALTGLKIYEEQGKTPQEMGNAYFADVDMYMAFHRFFKIPVIENEYQAYRVTRAENAGNAFSTAWETEVRKPLGEGEDYFEFAPMIVIQEENVLDGKTWLHPDAAATDAADGSDAAESAHSLKNRMLFAFSNRTAKGAVVDTSQIEAGYGVYEMPFEIVSNAAIRKTPKSRVVVNPEPLTEELKMVYPLDKDAEYVEMTLSDDHRYLALFSVKEGMWRAELVDADSWTSPGPIRLFPASQKITYAWGEDGSLAATGHQGYVAVLAREEKADAPEGAYKVLYSGQPGKDFDSRFFDGETDRRGDSYERYGHRADRGLVLAVKDGKAALAQNLLAGPPAENLRNAALECAVIDGSGVLYRGLIKSDIVDMGYDMSRQEAQAAKARLENDPLMIRPVRSENRIRWED